MPHSPSDWGGDHSIVIKSLPAFLTWRSWGADALAARVNDNINNIIMDIINMNNCIVACDSKVRNNGLDLGG